MAENMVSLVKRAAVEAVEAGKPVTVVFGTVLSPSPLEIDVEQKMTLKAKQLILTRNVTDYTVEMTMQHETEAHTHTHTITDTWSGGGSASAETHKHEYKGTKIFRVHNALKAGERVVLIRLQGGQKFIVWDRLGGMP